MQIDDQNFSWTWAWHDLAVLTQEWYQSPKCDGWWEYSWTTQSSKKTQGIINTWRQTYYPSVECICRRVPCSRVTMYYHKKIQTLSLISSSRRTSASFHFYEFKEGKKHSLYLIKRWVHSHMFYEPEKGGFLSQKGSFIVLFYESDESELSIIHV